MSTQLKQKPTEQDLLTLITLDNPKFISQLSQSPLNQLLANLPSMEIPLIIHLIQCNTINILTALFTKHKAILCKLHLPLTNSNLLHLAIQEQKCQLIKLIISNFSIKNFTNDNKGNTELHQWVIYHSNCEKCLKLLSSVGNEITSYMTIENHSGLTPLELALSYGNETVCLLLMKNFRFDYEHKDKSNETIMHKIARSNLIGIIDLVSCKSIINCQSLVNQTCLTIALGKGNYYLAEFFIDKGIQVTKEDKCITDSISDIPFSLAKKIKMKKIGISSPRAITRSNNKHDINLSINASRITRSASMTHHHSVTNALKEKTNKWEDSCKKISKFSVGKIKTYRNGNTTGKHLNINDNMKCLKPKNSESSITMLTTYNLEKINGHNNEITPLIVTKSTVNPSSTQKRLGSIRNFAKVKSEGKSLSLCNSNSSRLITSSFNCNGIVNPIFNNDIKKKPIHKTYTNLTTKTIPSNRNKSNENHHPMKKNNSYNATLSIHNPNNLGNSVTSTNQKKYLSFNYIKSFHILSYDDIAINTTDILHYADHCMIYKGKYLSLPVAIKVFQMEKMSHEELINFNSEIMLHINLRHPSIVSFVGFCIKDNHFLLLTEFMENNNLKTVLENHSISLLQTDKLRIIHQIAIGVLYLHKRNPLVLHRDLKSSNVLMDKYYNARLCDFGISKALNISDDGDNTMKTNCQSTPYWMAPEFIIEGKFNEKSDVYSFGILLWEVVMRDTLPYKNRNQFDFILGNKETLKSRPLINEEYDVKSVEMTKDCYDMIKRLMIKCWDEISAKRPTMAEIVIEIEKIIMKDKVY